MPILQAWQAFSPLKITDTIPLSSSALSSCPVTKQPPPRIRGRVSVSQVTCLWMFWLKSATSLCSASCTIPCYQSACPPWHWLARIMNRHVWPCKNSKAFILSTLKIISEQRSYTCINIMICMSCIASCSKIWLAVQPLSCTEDPEVHGDLTNIYFGITLIDKFWLVAVGQCKLPIDRCLTKHQIQS